MTRIRLKKNVRDALYVTLYIVIMITFGLWFRSYLMNLAFKIEQCDDVHGYCSINQVITFEGSDK